MRLLAVLAFAGVLAGFAGAARPVLSVRASSAAPGDAVRVRISGVRPGPARLVLNPGSITLDPRVHVSRRGTAAFATTIPNVIPGSYRLSLGRSGRTIARAPRPLTVLDGPPGVRSCQSSVYGELGPDWERSALRAGPLALVDWGISEDYVLRHKRIKVLVVADHDAVATLRVAATDRRSVALLYAKRGGLGGESARRVTDGLAAVRFHGCPPGDGRPHTQFNGTFIVDRPRCAHLEVYVQGRPEPIPAAISFGAPC